MNLADRCWAWRRAQVLHGVARTQLQLQQFPTSPEGKPSGFHVPNAHPGVRELMVGPSLDRFSARGGWWRDTHEQFPQQHSHHLVQKVTEMNPRTSLN